MASKVCEQCKSHSPGPPRSARGSPCGSSSRTWGGNKPSNVRTEPSEMSHKTCIVLGKGPDKISLQYSSSATTKLRLSGCGSCKIGTGDDISNSCIQIMGTSIIKTCNGALQIVSGEEKAAGGRNSGGVKISLGGSCPTLQLGSSLNSRGSGGGGAIVRTGRGGQLQLSFGKGNGGSPSIACGQGCSNVKICFGSEHVQGQ